MSIAAKLFQNDDTEVETLHGRVMPTNEQREAQTERWNELADYLRDYLKEKTGYNVKPWIQGSYKFGTQVRPARMVEEFDIDLGVYLEWPGKPEDNMKASVLKQHVQDGIKSFAAEAEGVKEVVSPPKERCARLVYEDHFHIDIPGYHFDSDRDGRSVATGTNLLTVLATEAFREISSNFTEDDDVCEAVLGKIVERLEADREVPNPVDATENLNRLDDERYDAFLQKLRDFHEELRSVQLQPPRRLNPSIFGPKRLNTFFPRR